MCPPLECAKVLGSTTQTHTLQHEPGLGMRSTPSGADEWEVIYSDEWDAGRLD